MLNFGGSFADFFVFGLIWEVLVDKFANEVTDGIVVWII